jgi:LacI family transcriptional regulator, xylobiose transport system transcriptional regulator
VPRATLADVASAAGVSIPTASKVLNGKSHVATETRLKVLEAARASGYETSRALAGSRAGLVDLLIEGIGSPWAIELIDGAEYAAARRGFSLALTSCTRPEFDLHSWVRQVRERRTDGIVLALARAAGREEIDALRDLLRVPVVLLDPVGGRDPRIPTVGATNWAGGVAATTHLLELGHTRIGFIGGPADTQCSRDRHEGYLAAHRQLGVEPDPELVRFGDFLTSGGRKFGAELLGLADPPTAIFAGSDLQAAGVYQAATERGLRIPEDLSVVGFDDVSLCQTLSPPLTTIRQPLREMAQEAVRLVADELSHPSTTGTRLELATTLILRDSAAVR